MLDGLFTSKMRVQILMRLFLNTDSRPYLRELAKEFDASPAHVRSELLQLSGAGLVTSEKQGRQVHYSADQSHPLFPELQSMVRKALGMDRIVDSIDKRLGDVEAACLIGDYAEGRDTGMIYLVLVGEIDGNRLADFVACTERQITRRIRVYVLTEDEFLAMSESGRLTPSLALWSTRKGSTL